MIVVDTDHLSVLTFPEYSRFATLSARISGVSSSEVGTTIVNVEETMRGWLADINRRRSVQEQIIAYDRLAHLFKFFARWSILRFDERAAEEFQRLRKQKIHIGTMDVKIAAIALVQAALLISANLRDFRQAPGLRVENWLEERMGE